MPMMMMMNSTINLEFSNLKFPRNPYSNNSLLITNSHNPNHTSFQTSQDLAHSFIHEFNPIIPIQEAITPPSSWYTSPSILSLEFDQVFFKGWQAVGNLIYLYVIIDNITNSVCLFNDILFD